MSKFGVKLKPTNSTYIRDYSTNNPNIPEKQKKEAGLILDNQKKGENFCQKFINIPNNKKEAIDPEVKKRNYNTGLNLLREIIKKHLFVCLKNLGKAVMNDYMIKLKTVEVELAEAKNAKYDLELDVERYKKENDELKEMLNIFNEKFCEMQNSLPKTPDLIIEKQENMNLTISPKINKTNVVNITEDNTEKLQLKEEKKKTNLRSRKKQDNEEIKTNSSKKVNIVEQPKENPTTTEATPKNENEKNEVKNVETTQNPENKKEEENEEARQTRMQKSRKLRSLLNKKGKEKHAKLLKYFKKFYFNGVICSVKKRAREKSIDLKDKRNKHEDKATKFLINTKTMKYSKVLELSREEKIKKDREDRKIFLLKSFVYKKDRLNQIALKKTFQKYNLRCKILSLNAQKLERKSRRTGKSRKRRKDKSTSIDGPKKGDEIGDETKKNKKDLMKSVNVNLNVNKFLSSSSIDYNDEEKKDNLHVVK